MRICIVTNFYPPIQTGSCYWAKNIAINHKRLGDEIIVVTAGRNAKVAVSNEDGITVYRLPAIFRLPRIGFFLNFEHFYLINSRRNREALQTILQEHKIQVVHISNHLLDAVFLANHVCKKLNIPRICSIHGQISHSGNRFYNLIMNAIDKTFIKKTMNQMDSIVALDKPTELYIKSTYKPKNLRLIPLVCVGDDFFIKNPQVKIADKPKNAIIKVASLGHMTENRNRCDLVRAIPEILKAGLQAEFHIIGKVLCQDAVKLAQRLGVTEHIKFLGELQQAEMFQYLKEMDLEVHLFFMPGLGCATLEAMAMGLPTIAYGYEGIYGDVPFKDRVNIVFANPNDQASVNRALIDLISDANLRKNVGAAARQVIQKHLTWDQSIHQYIDLFKKLSTG